MIGFLAIKPRNAFVLYRFVIFALFSDKDRLIRLTNPGN